MTPYEIDVLLWYYGHAEDHPDAARNPSLWRPTLKKFFDEDLISASRDERTCKRCYDLAPRGRAFIESLLRVPLPEVAWLTRWPEAARLAENTKNAPSPMGESAP